jgi:NADH-quinone oxidoreductase subunit G
MEFLLINHPLDCPICDQGGECDLQDQAMAYGTGNSRFHEHKRAVQDKYMGPLVKTQMTRCIHCTRCIRFSTEIAGVPELGAFGRGEHMEVSTYVEKSLTSELSANIVDLCPVGALTSRPYAFASRPWELKKTESIDVMDAVGSAIRVDSRQNAVLRVLPRLNEDVNEEWISDKTRHACDGLKVQRLDRPYVRRNGKLEETSWADALNVVASKMKATAPEKIAALAGDMTCVESLFALKQLLTTLGIANMDCRQDGAMIDASNRASYLFNTTIAGIENADVLLLVGTNPRHEAAIINARIRKTWLKGKLKIYAIGEPVELTYGVEWLGNDPMLLKAIASGSHPLAQVFSSAERPMMIVGQGAVARYDGEDVLSAALMIANQCGFIKDGWNGYNMLHMAAGRVGALDVGFVPQKGGMDIYGIMKAAHKWKVEVIYLLGADEIDTQQLGNAFVIYQGHHGDRGAHRADVILPGCAYTEKNATYVNTEGRVQRTSQAVFAPGEAREDWKIIRALSEAVGYTLPYNTLDELRAELFTAVPHMAHEDRITTAAWQQSDSSAISRLKIQDSGFAYPVSNFYMTDSISRASRTMAQCVTAREDANREAA